MTQTTDNKQLPLWKVLNEKRTQGEWRAQPEKSPISGKCEYVFSDEYNALVSIHYGQTEDQRECNAQYTALSVNNLANLAEALESSMQEIKSLLCNYAGYSTNESYANYYGNSGIYLKIKEALARIS